MGQLTSTSLTDSKVQNIWRYSRFYTPAVAPSHQITLEEGGTRVAEVVLDDHTDTTFLIKREDLNPNGSHKDRTAAYQISHYRHQGHRSVLISSSGNAAVSLSAYGARAGMEVLAFVKPSTPKFKLFQMARFGPRLIYTPKPINLANYTSRRYGIPNLRPSKDDTAIEGYRSLAYEIYEGGHEPDSIFTFATSGTTVLGLAGGYRDLVDKGLVSSPPSLHAVQSGSIDSIARAFSPSSEPSGETKPPRRKRGQAGRLGVKNTARKDEVVAAIRETGGSSWSIDPKEVDEAGRTLSRLGFNTSLEGAASWVAAVRASREGAVRRPLVIFTGHISQLQGEVDFDVPGEHFPSYNDLRLVFDQEYPRS